MVILPCELIERNGTRLREYILRHARDWDLPEDFLRWVLEDCLFYDTLVDRIVTGYPREEAEDICTRLGYEDRLLDTSEVFHLWVLQGDPVIRELIPFERCGLQVSLVPDITPYRERKVRLLNGAHTMTVPAAYLCGHEAVRETVQDPVLGLFMKRGMLEEILPTVRLPEREKREFALQVLERFSNPYIHHLLLSIALNSVAKWTVRVLPSLKDALDANGTLPRVLSFSLSALIAFYRVTGGSPDAYTGTRGGGVYPIDDDAEVMQRFAQAWRAYEADRDLWALADTLLRDTALWGVDLTDIAGLCGRVTEDLKVILQRGMYEAVKECVQ